MSDEFNNNEAITLLSVDHSSIIAFHESGNANILSSDGTLNDNALYDIVYSQIEYNVNVTDKFTLDENEVFEYTLPAEKIVNMYSEKVENLRENYYVNSTIISEDVIEHGDIDFTVLNNSLIAPDNTLISYNPTATAVGDYLDQYEIVPQGSLPICWAATIASILRWEMPDIYAGYTGTDVCDYLGHSYTGAFDKDVDKYLKTFLTPYNDNYIPTYTSNAYQETEIRQIINNEDAAYMSAKGATGGRHATALCGYLKFSDNTFAVRLMNPGNGTFQLSDRSYSSTTFRYAYNGTYFTWDRSVRFYYRHA
ncbi:MAG: hypothetical protein K2G36_06170 [Ruminococcus sp.]|nr:hypothetical protein [Ruminococcus sp.]